MKQFLRRVSPRRAVSDFHDQWKQPTPHRWQILGVAMAATFCVFTLFVPDSVRVQPMPPEVIYISTFDETRTEAEIIASNCANQQLKDELQARLDESAERRREMYETLGRATFIDVDEMERQIEAERAAEEAAQDGPTEEEIALSVEEYCARAAG
ncbi:hypothetical protein [Aurantiacibacter gilvus]|uniref:Uncharacterized protein n=1 Tax=Aurantiacibacter gilvus TaxID=3139141 RepID=A0ABU9IG16_9SPHN